MPALTLDEAVTEMGKRGFAYLAEDRRKRMLRVAYADICEMQPWPWLLASTSGAAPLTVADLRTIESVVDATHERKLLPEDVRNLTDRDPTLARTGTPAYYYVDRSGSDPVVRAYPVESVTLSVRYYKTPAEWDDTDEPLVPAQYQDAIVDYAVARAHADAKQYDAATAARAEGDRLVGRMLQNMLTPQADRPGESQAITGGHADWM